MCAANPTSPLHCRAILFALSFFHAALLERKKFGTGNLPGARSGIGWNMGYPFNVGDLLCCGQLAANYLDNSTKVRAGGADTTSCRPAGSVWDAQSARLLCVSAGPLG